MWFEWKVAWRFLISGRLQSLLILLGIMVGVAVQVFLGSLISGLQSNLIYQTVGNASHITITSEESIPRSLINDDIVFNTIVTTNSKERELGKWKEIEELLTEEEEITSLSPTISYSAFGIKGAKTIPTIIRGVELNKADEIYNISGRMNEGEDDISGNTVLIGIDLAEALKAEEGDVFTLRNAEGVEDRFMVGGIFDLQSATVNERWIFMSLQRASSFFDLTDQITSLEIQIKDVFMANELADKLNAKLENVEVESWQRSNAQLLTALQSQASSSLIIQIFIMIAVTLGISSVLAVSVVQRGKQIGILKAMGVKPKRVGRIFLIQGALLGGLGSILGVIMGTALGQVFVQLVRTESGEPLFPIEIDIRFIIISACIATLAGMVAALIPARNSARLSPIEVIRNG